MTKKMDVLRYYVCFLFLLFIFSSSPVFAQSTNNNPWVKIQNGKLWVLSSDNATYTPYFVKAVGYSPTPIGRYPSDWGYATTDPHYFKGINNNFYDDPAILKRDFNLLQAMNANTIRIWQGNNTFNPSIGRFTSYITNASNTANSDTTQNTLDLADNKGLKVIAGFWVNPLTFNSTNQFNVNNPIGSTDSSGKAINGDTIINNFVNYVNAFKGNRAILFWAIGNENNYQLVPSQTQVSLNTFESDFGPYGSVIFTWLQQNSYVDSNGNVLVGVNSSVFQNSLESELNYIGDYNASDYSTILDLLAAPLSPQQLAAWYNLVDAMAVAAHLAEDSTGGTDYHPVAVVNGEIAEIGNSADGAADTQLQHLDIWGVNAYRGESFGTGPNSLFSQYAAKSQKPLWISEFGVDAWWTQSPTFINNWGSTLDDDLGGTGFYDPMEQSTWDGELWNEILTNSNVSIGGSVMEYSDEWWKPYEFYCTNSSLSQAVNASSAGICNSNQKYFGAPFPGFPDSFMNQEWFGMMSISSNPNPSNPNQWGPDTMTPRYAYSNLQVRWKANPWAHVTLNITGPGMGIIKSTSPSLGTGLNCNFSSGSSTGTCSAYFPLNQLVRLYFSSNNDSVVASWGASSCTSGSTACTITPPATDMTLNLTVAQIPATPSLTARAIAPSSVLLHWTASTSKSNIPIKTYTIERNGKIAAIVTNNPTTSWTDTSIISGTYYSYQIFATDQMGNNSLLSNQATLFFEAGNVGIGNTGISLTVVGKPKFLL